jgi:hypothetical protein
MPMIFYCIKLHLFTCNGSQVVSIKQNTNFNIQMPSTFVFLFFTQKVLLIAVHPLNIYQHTQHFMVPQ